MNHVEWLKVGLFNEKTGNGFFVFLKRLVTTKQVFDYIEIHKAGTKNDIKNKRRKMIMNISNTINAQVYGRQMPNAAKKSENICFNNVMKPEGEDKVLEYYHDLCRQYPDVTFRLDDMQRGDNKLGYNDSMNQVGDDFGAHGRCSISIDVSVIRKMMQDDSYANKAKGWIEETERHYADYERETKECGMKYTSVTLTDENGRLTQGVMHSMQPHSTEEDVRAMWQNEKSARYMEMLKKQLLVDTDMYDRLFGDKEKIK